MPTIMVSQNSQGTVTPQGKQQVTCPTCRNGCECTGPNPLNGCQHYGCWGPAATGTCASVPAMRATVTASKLFGGAA